MLCLWNFKFKKVYENLGYNFKRKMQHLFIAQYTSTRSRLADLPYCHKRVSLYQQGNLWFFGSPSLLWRDHIWELYPASFQRRINGIWRGQKKRIRRVILDDSSCLVIDPQHNGQDSLVQSWETKGWHSLQVSSWSGSNLIKAGLLNSILQWWEQLDIWRVISLRAHASLDLSFICSK